jgi:hypothetical protein
VPALGFPMAVCPIGSSGSLSAILGGSAFMIKQYAYVVRTGCDLQP